MQLRTATRYVHTNIVAENWEVLVKFYCDVFDCTPVPPMRDLSGDWLARGSGVADAAFKGMHLRLPGCGDDGPTLEIYQYSEMEQRAPIAANRKGFGHIAFRVDDVAAMYDRVLEHGGSAVGEIVEHEVAGVGMLTFVYLADPEGNIVELQSWA